MLDKSKLIAQLNTMADALFMDQSCGGVYAYELWQKIIQDSSFIYKVRQVDNPPWPVPEWQDSLGQVIEISQQSQEHIVVSVDGSQIYPDRHNVASCFLINIGGVVLPYLAARKPVELLSMPMVFTGENDDFSGGPTELVNCKRQEYELQEGLTLSERIQSTYPQYPIVLLFDGSLIFWHLSSKEKDMKHFFLNMYCGLLDQLYNQKVLSAWYISAPKSKELVNLLRLELCDFKPENTQSYEVINRVIDSTIMHHFLPPYTRTILFKNCSSVTHFYPAHVRPFFFYLHTGQEIGRVEIPAWIAHDNHLVDTIAQIVIDQCKKGGGYPVALAEAHEQAVVKGPDRDFFYHFLQKMIIERGKYTATSRKSLKKRGMGI